MTPKPAQDKPVGKASRRCVALDSHGKQCRSTRTRVGYYHGDGEIYDHIVELSDEKTPAWVFVRLCELHHGDWEKMKGKQGAL